MLLGGHGGRITFRAGLDLVAKLDSWFRSRTRLTQMPRRSRSAAEASRSAG